jgi:hypothetical protein
MNEISPLRGSEANEMKPGEENAATALEVIGNYGAVFKLEAEGRFDEFCRDLEQILRK